MTDQFRRHIRESLSDRNLHAALDANAERRIQVRQQAFTSLENPEELRQQAHRVRAEVIDHLDKYLEQFIEQASKNGMQIHRAMNADQALEAVLEIASRQNARLIAKAKTMVSEEIGLNHALEKHGLQVIETDLGEYIVQLRGEAPSHIITPAVHLRREDVGRLFEQKLGLPYTEDISLMTNAARRILRQVFLEADIGISGVNFGVAETGTLCVVTNEGNGRMVTTIPRTHIALMGIERLVPTLDDLALMLSLLPRSATGQKLSVYTSLLNRPRCASDPDGPTERHIILVDNGRSAVRLSELSEILYCIRCGSCLNACPVFREIGGHAYVSVDGEGSPYPGPIGSVISPALFGSDKFGQLARASSLCGACREACPVDIDLPKLLLRVRAGVGTEQLHQKSKSNAPWWLAAGINFYTIAATSLLRFTIAQHLAGFFGSMVTRFSKSDPWIRMPQFSGWGYSKDFPRPAAKPYHSRPGKQAIKESASYITPPLSENTFPPLSDRRKNPAYQKDILIKKFATELDALGGKLYSSIPTQTGQLVLDILLKNDIYEILAWNEIYLPDGVLAKLAQAQIGIIYPSVETIQGDSRARAGLSGARAAIADTGSLVLVGGPGRPLTASLLPEIHIALVRDTDILESLHQALQLEELKQASASVLVTGPSRTADIEMTLTIGVHGPGELHVICITSE